jgi:hypothetical protein
MASLNQLVGQYCPAHAATRSQTDDDFVRPTLTIVDHSVVSGDCGRKWRIPQGLKIPNGIITLGAFDELYVNYYDVNQTRRDTYDNEIAVNREWYRKHAKELYKVFNEKYVAIHNQCVIQQSDYPFTPDNQLLDPRAFTTYIGSDFMTDRVVSWLNLEGWKDH